MGDWHSPDIREMMIEMIRNLTSQAWVDHIRSRIDDTRTYQVMIIMVMEVMVTMAFRTPSITAPRRI